MPCVNDDVRVVAVAVVLCCSYALVLSVDETDYELGFSYNY